MSDAPLDLFAATPKPVFPGSTQAEPLSDELSRTSVWAAAARAMGARIVDPRVRNPDWLAEKFLGPEELALLGEHPLAAALGQPYAEAIQNPQVLRPVRKMVVRTRFIDDRLEAGIRNGIEQLVIMGAGFDSRAYRFAPRLAGVTVFEVDKPNMQRLKRRRVAEALGGLPSNVAYVPVDFRRQGFGDALLEAGFRPHRKSLFIWEGVTVYLPGEAVRDTLRWVAANTAPGSTILFDYSYENDIRPDRIMDSERVSAVAKEALKHFHYVIANEPWLFGIPERTETAFLREVGLELREVLGINSAEAVRKYLTHANGRPFATRFLPKKQGYMILEAAVPA